MKTRILFTALLFLGLFSWSNKNAEKQASEMEPVKVCVTPGMESLAESWISGYYSINPDQHFDLKQMNFADLKSEVTGDNTLGFVMQRPDMALVAKSMWHLTLGREIIVTVMNTSNPYTEILKSKGVSANTLARMISTTNPTWDNILSNGSNQPVRIVMEDAPVLRLAVSNYLDLDPLTVNSLKSGKDVTEMMSKDAYAIGFCRLSSITNTETREFVAQLLPLPIDRNGNGRIDYYENIYGKLDQFERGVWIGKYPHSLVYNIYAIAPDQPQDNSITDFLSWIITSGQSTVVESGYTDLAYYEIQSDLDKLNPAVPLTAEDIPKSYSTTTKIFIGLLVLAVFVAPALVRKTRRKSLELLYDDAEQHEVLRAETLEIPSGLFYDKTHTWAFMEKDGTVKVGIDDFLQHVTGNFTGLIMKSPNDMIRRNEIAATLVHEGKKINIYSPVSGRIKESNEDLIEFPSLVNNSPYSWGWLYEIEPSNWLREIRFLRMSEEYSEWIKKEFIRLKDFIINVCREKELAGQLVLQEGGELPDHVLHDFEPHVWEEFQISFIDNSDINEVL